MFNILCFFRYKIALKADIYIYLAMMRETAN